MFKTLSSWKSFLPPKSIVMARTQHHKAYRLTENSSVELVFVGENLVESEIDSEMDKNARLLLDRMTQAMGFPLGLKDPRIGILSTNLPPNLFRKPKIIVCLGEATTQTLLNRPEPWSHLRGKFYPSAQDSSTQLIPTFHPIYLLENPSAKRAAWTDLQLIATELGLNIPKRGEKKWN